MPAGDNTPSLAESWTVSKDGLTYEFVLRKGVKFHNGEPVTAEDVKFSFERYKGAGAKLLKERVREVQVVDPGRVRFVLKEPWPDFMTFYGTSATGAGWIVPKAYVEKVGDDGFKRAPIGAGPYKFVELQPGRRAGHGGVRGVLAQDAPTSSGSSSAACPTRPRARPPSRRARSTSPTSLSGPVAEDIQRTPGFKLVAAEPSRRRSGSTCPTSGIRSRRGTTGACGWPPASPSTARRSTRPRRSASRGRPAASSRACSSSRASSSRRPTIRRRPRSCWPRPAIRTASTPATSTRGRRTSRWARRSANYLQAVGIRTRMRTMERAALTRRRGARRSSRT